MEEYKTQKVRLGLVGLGYVGKIHLRNCLNLTNARLVAVCDLSKKALRDAKKIGVKKTFTDYEQLFKDPSIDAVIIALPTHLHSTCSQKAAEAEKDVFLEKPLARNVAEGKEIVSTVQKNGVKLMVGYPLRFTSSMRNLKKEIQSGVLGDVQVAYATNIGSGPLLHRSDGYIPLPVPTWWFKRELTGGGALIDLGSHMINLLRWYFGEVVDVRSYLGYRYNMDFEDYAICLVKFKSGTTAIINVGWFSQEYQLKVELLGTVKHAIARNLPPNPIISALQLLTTKSTRFWLPYIAELESFTNCVRYDSPPSPSGNDALNDLKVIASAYKNSTRL